MKKPDTSESLKHGARAFKKYRKNRSRRKRYALIKHRRKFLQNASLKQRNKTQAFLRTSKFLDDMTAKTLAATSQPEKTQQSITLPKNFCLIRHPGTAIKHISRAYDAATNITTNELIIDHSKVKSYNLSSETLLGLAIDNALKRKKAAEGTTKHLHITGILPNNTDHNQLIREIGVIREIDGQTVLPAPLSKEKQHLFSQQSAGTIKADAYSNDFKTNTSIEFSEHVDRCLQDHLLTLNPEASSQLMTTVSEVLDNAERHSSTSGYYNWYARGYLNGNSESEHMEISILNFGMTIAESFERLPDDNFGKQLVMDYVSKHLNSTDRELLVTVAALQQRYSSTNTSETDTNGQGMTILIEFFEKLCIALTERDRFGSVKPLMSIVSGNTHVLFDGTYKLFNLSDYSASNEGDEQFGIAFNAQNDLKLPPDPKYVRKMDGAFFPGVVISIRFPLKELEEEEKI